MISFLKGIIEDKQENLLQIDVNGVGYELCVSTNTLSSLPMQGNAVKVLTYMAVREDGVSLYGFSSQEEKELFSKLITVSGIGPKLAISILSGMSLADLTLAIIKEDLKLLSKIKGLGKKTAERLCLELKDKLSVLGDNSNDATFQSEFDEDAVQMATDTLISLGINKNDAYMLARSYASKDATAEEIISKALRGYKG
ncbi:MAG: Holliday junction branch migration protein RuvA [Clostridia bacterium]|nr:Holliday junction branch migration protein RuvA [Clostridia bacterium]